MPVSNSRDRPRSTQTRPTPQTIRYGVWTLPPVSNQPKEGEEAPEGWDPEAYKAIGESDRMTLKFIKPAE
jgi:predicted methyltransferase